MQLYQAPLDRLLRSAITTGDGAADRTVHTSGPGADDGDVEPFHSKATYHVGG